MPHYQGIIVCWYMRKNILLSFFAAGHSGRRQSPSEAGASLSVSPRSAHEPEPSGAFLYLARGAVKHSNEAEDQDQDQAKADIAIARPLHIPTGVGAIGKLPEHRTAHGVREAGHSIGVADDQNPRDHDRSSDGCKREVGKHGLRLDHSQAARRAAPERSRDRTGDLEGHEAPSATWIAKPLQVVTHKATVAACALSTVADSLEGRRPGRSPHREQLGHAVAHPRAVQATPGWMNIELVRLLDV